MNIKKSFGIALATRDISQKGLSEKMGVSGSYISNVINKGSVSIKKLDEISEELGYKLWEFLKLGDDQ